MNQDCDKKLVFNINNFCIGPIIVLSYFLNCTMLIVIKYKQIFLDTWTLEFAAMNIDMCVKSRIIANEPLLRLFLGVTISVAFRLLALPRICPFAAASL